ncbi:MAG: LysR family transcriptional regulator [Deltaproteobacteria bacterium]|nr:LysR family transcriptional regulator [Deltaproteobacteria bacterium]
MAIEGSVVGAAERLGVTSATVSEQVRTLERTLGRTLFDRLQTGLQLTEAGRMTFEHTMPMFRLGERLVTLVGKRQDADRLLRVGVCGPTARSSTTELVIPLFELQDLRPMIRNGETAELTRELRAGNLDLVLIESHPSESMLRGLEVVLIHQMQFIAIAPPDIEPRDDWADVRMVQYSAATSYRHAIESFLEQASLRPSIVGEADDPHVHVEAAARGGCIAIVPRPAALDALLSGRVRIVREIEDVHLAIHALFRENAPARQAVRALIVAATATSKGE